MSGGLNDFLGVLCPMLVVLPIGAVVLWAALGTWVGGRRFASLDEFMTHVNLATGLRGAVVGSSWFSSVADVVFDGTLPSRRAARIRFERHQAGKSSYLTVHLAVAIDPDVRFEMTPEGFLSRLGAWLGLGDDLHTGDADFDGRYWIQSETAGRTLAGITGDVKGVVESLFQAQGARRLRSDGSWLEAELLASNVDPSGYAAVLAQLETAARAFDRSPIRVRVLGQVRKAVQDARGATRCALCHEGISGEEADLVACDRCHTVLHDECWRELGRCPLLGCVGRSPERARAAG